MLKIDSDEKVADWQVSCKETDIAGGKATTKREGGVHDVRGRLLGFLLSTSPPQRLKDKNQCHPSISARGLVNVRIL